jgi:4,5-epoxidase
MSMAASGVLVAGAGPTGLTLACGLLAGGVPTRVVDKAEGPAETSRALGLQPRGIEVLARLRALNSLPERALQLERIVVHIDGAPAATVRVGQPTDLVTRPGLVISQADVEAELRRRVTDLGGRIEWGREVADAHQDPDGVTAVFADGDQSRASWLVGCDGAHSRVRDLAGVGFHGAPLAERFLLADVHADLPWPRHSILVWLAGRSVFGAFPLPGRDVWRLMAPAAADDPTTTDTVLADTVLADVVRLLEERTGCDPSLIGDPVWVTSFRIHRRLAETYRNGRILLAGDAAHVHSPFGGQGMNTGIGDGENLAWKLAMVADATAGDGLLDTYEAERRPIAAAVVRSTGRAGDLVLGNHPLVRLLRDRIVIPLITRERVQRRIWEGLSQLRVTYRDGPLGSRGRRWPRGSGPLPGDRIPDLDCTRADDGTPTTLHASLGAGWALVLPAGTPHDTLTAVAAARLGDHRVVTLVADHDPGDEAMLVRPDAHLGWRGRPDPDALDQWLAAATGRRRPAERRNSTRRDRRQLH